MTWHEKLCRSLTFSRIWSQVVRHKKEKQKNGCIHPPSGLLVLYMLCSEQIHFSFNNRTADPSITRSFPKQGFNWLSLQTFEFHSIKSVSNWLNWTNFNLWGGSWFKYHFLFFFPHHPASCLLYPTEGWLFYIWQVRELSGRLSTLMEQTHALISCLGTLGHCLEEMTALSPG